MDGKIGTLGVGFLVLLALSSAAVSAHEEMLGSQPSSQNITGKEVQSHLGYKHVWPDIRFGWKIVVGTMIAFVGAAFGSVGGVGGGGFFIPMLTLITGFDQKSSIAVSKCKNIYILSYITVLNSSHSCANLSCSFLKITGGEGERMR
ncbi:unnamed protein product [Prunus brigantina]